MTDPSPHPVDRALSWLAVAQAPTGEIPAWASPLEDAEPVWVPDSLNFITGLATTALAAISRPEAAAIVELAVAFLDHERQRNGLWRYWAATNEQTDFTPADADDTACCSLAVAAGGLDPSDNVPLLLANRDGAGRFWTWFVPRPGWSGVRLHRALAAERRPAVRHLRHELWRTTEADPDDVDVVVNANVCRYLGPKAPGDAAGWVASELRAGRDIGADKWHRNATTYYLSVAEGARRGVPGFDALEGLVVDRIARAWAGGRIAVPLDQAQAALALQAYDAAPDLVEELAVALERTQLDSGAWARSVFYYGGPKEVFGWASEALATAYAATVLSQRGRS